MWDKCGLSRGLGCCSCPTQATRGYGLRKVSQADCSLTIRALAEGIYPAKPFLSIENLPKFSPNPAAGLGAAHCFGTAYVINPIAKEGVGR